MHLLVYEVLPVEDTKATNERLKAQDELLLYPDGDANHEANETWWWARAKRESVSICPSRIFKRGYVAEKTYTKVLDGIKQMSYDSAPNVT